MIWEKNGFGVFLENKFNIIFCVQCCLRKNKWNLQSAFNLKAIKIMLIEYSSDDPSTYPH